MRSRVLFILMLGACLVFTAVAQAAEPAAPVQAAPASTAPAAPAEPAFLVAGAQASDLFAVNEEGKKVDLAKEFAGQKKVIVFMNTACGACRQELDHMNIYMQNVKAKFMVLSVDMGGYDVVDGYKKSARLSGKWYQDADFTVPPKFNINFTPGLVVLDGSGTVLLIKGGYNPRKAKALEAELNTVLQ